MHTPDSSINLRQLRAFVSITLLALLPVLVRAEENVPIITDPPEYVTAHVGEPASVCATVLSAGRVSLQWLFDGISIPGATNACVYPPTDTIYNNGYYALVASNSSGSVTSRLAFFEVYPWYWVDFAWGGPTAVAGTDIGLRVSLTEDSTLPHTASVKWFHNGKRIPGQRGETLWILNLTTNDAGEYFAIVTSPTNGTHRSEPVQVGVEERAPFLDYGATPLFAVEGESLLLSSRAFTRDVQYRWTRNGRRVAGGNKPGILFERIRPQDAGEYTVSVSNRMGGSSGTINLSVRPRTTLDDWGWLSPSPQGARLNGITYGRGRFVAVGNSGNAVVSDDGVAWRAVQVGTSANLDDIGYANGQFYAMSESQSLFVSSDGLKWRVTALPDASYFYGITAANGRIAAVSYEPGQHVRERGRAWQRVPQPGYIALGAGNLFISWYRIGETEFQFFYSKDAQHWSKSALTRPTVASQYGILEAARGPEYIVITEDLAIFTSPDAKAWTQTAALNALPYRSALAASPDRYVITYDRQAISSGDARTWVYADTGSEQDLEDVVYGEGKFIAVGRAGTIMSSPDGVQWSSLVQNTFDLYGLAEGNGTLVAVGDGPAILTSSEGTQWTSREANVTENLHGITFANDLFVAVGRRGTLLTSPNAIEWTPRNSGVTSDLQRVVFAAGQWIAVGERNSAASSVDGINWTPLTIAPIATDHEGVAYANGRWIVAGGYHCTDIGLPCHQAVSTFYVSTNGLQWQALINNYGVRMRDITSGNGQFVAVGNDGTLAVSQNGESWFSFYIPFRNFRRVYFGGGRFVAVGNDGACYSSATPSDASTWIQHRSPVSQNLHDVMQRSDGRVLAVGNNQIIIQTTEPLGN